MWGRTWSPHPIPPPSAPPPLCAYINFQFFWVIGHGRPLQRFGFYSESNRKLFHTVHGVLKARIMKWFGKDLMLGKTERRRRG